MAKEMITQKCGCEKEFNLVGKMADRERKAAWLKQQVCGKCKIEANLAELPASSVALVELTGSEKQIAWATTIRAKQIAILEGIRERVQGNKGKASEADFDALMGGLQSVITKYAGVTSSRQWIDMRDWGEAEYNGEIHTAYQAAKKA